MENVLDWIVHYEYPVLFLLLMLGIFGLPIPDETILIFSGYLVYSDQLTLGQTVFSAFLGSLCGISLSYGLGRWLGLRLFHHYRRFFSISPEVLDQTRAWYENKGKYALLFGYYLPGIRHLTAFVAGSSQLPVSIFVLFAYFGALVWTSTFIYFGYWLGNEWKRFADTIHHSLLWGTAGIIAIVILVGYARWKSS